MRKEYVVHCTYEVQHRFSDGLGIVKHDAIILVRTQHEERIESLLNTWGEGQISFIIKEIRLNGEIEGDNDDVVKAYDSILSVRPAN